MGHLCKNIDIQRIRRSSDDVGFMDLLSLEYLMEIYCSIYYYTWVKLYVAFHQPSHIMLILTFLSQFLTESIETNVKFTEYYYRRADWLEKRFMMKFTGNMVNEDVERETLVQWRNRL